MNGSFIELLGTRAKADPDRPALLHNVGGTWAALTWREVFQVTDQLAQGLLSLGLRAGDRVGLFARTGLEWVLADLGILKAGCCTVPVHPNSLPDQVHHVLADSGARALFVETEREQSTFRAIKAELLVERVVVMRGPARGQDELPWEELQVAGRVHAAEFPGALAARSLEIDLRSLATIVYTSGTTGQPKGVMLTHGNLLFETEALRRAMQGFIGPDDLHLVCLPLGHILSRIMVLTGIVTGYANALACDQEALERDMLEVQPTFMTVVPHLLEQFHTHMRREIVERSMLSRKAIRWAQGVTQRAAAFRGRRMPLPWTLSAMQAVGRRLVLNPDVLGRFGGRLKFFLSGGAPLSQAIAEYFESLGILVLEGYGLTETSGAANVNRPDRYRLGTVGLPVLGVEERIAPDGEILIRGPCVMAGYYNQPAATAEAIDTDGFLHTGDLGELEPDGFLRVTSRKKDIIVTSSGLNVAPQNIENLLRTSRYIRQAIVVGDRRPFLTVLLSLDEENLQRFAEEEGLPFDRVLDLAVHPRVLELLQREIDGFNRELASHETIRRFSVLPEPLSIAQSELTPTFKVRRQEVEARYRQLIETMYASPAPGWSGGP